MKKQFTFCAIIALALALIATTVPPTPPISNSSSGGVVKVTRNANVLSQTVDRSTVTPELVTTYADGTVKRTPLYRYREAPVPTRYTSDRLQALRLARATAEAENAKVEALTRLAQEKEQARDTRRLTHTRTFSKLKLIRALKASGAWERVKAFIASSGLEDEWQACQVIYEADEAFVQALSQARQLIQVTDAQVEAILSQCIVDAN